MQTNKPFRSCRTSSAHLVLPILFTGSLVAAGLPVAKGPIAHRFVDGLREQTARVAVLPDRTLVAVFLRNTQAGPELVARYSHDNGWVWGEIQRLCFLPRDEI